MKSKKCVSGCKKGFRTCFSRFPVDFSQLGISNKNQQNLDPLASVLVMEINHRKSYKNRYFDEIMGGAPPRL